MIFINTSTFLLVLLHFFFKYNWNTRLEFRNPKCGVCLCSLLFKLCPYFFCSAHVMYFNLWPVEGSTVKWPLLKKKIPCFAHAHEKGKAKLGPCFHFTAEFAAITETLLHMEIHHFDYPLSNQPRCKISIISMNDSWSFYVQNFFLLKFLQPSKGSITDAYKVETSITHSCLMCLAWFQHMPKRTTLQQDNPRHPCTYLTDQV